MSKTANDTILCQNSIEKYLVNLTEQWNQYEMELIKQSQSYPNINLSLNEIDNCLKEYVHVERNYTSRKNIRLLNKFKDIIHEKHLSQTIINNDEIVSEHIVYNLLYRFILYLFSLERISQSIDIETRKTM